VNDIYATEIAILHQISRAVIRERNVQRLLQDVLDILHREIGFLRGTFTLLRGDTLHIEASQGLTGAETARGTYRLGEGVTGRVAQTAKSVLIPDISRSPEFLNRTGTRSGVHDVAFLCVPIVRVGGVVGTLSMDRQVSDPSSPATAERLRHELALLETVANIMAEAVEACRQEHLEREKLLADNQSLRRQLGDPSRAQLLLGNSNAMRAVEALVEQVAPTPATVLIRGSSGTGKELVARTIVRLSPRADKPFVVVNCAAIPEALVESELFGHERGAFTGAVAQRVGRAEAADGGTLFLDEVGDLAPSAQVKLLRFLQERTFSRVGSNEVRRVDVRILAATSRDLESLMASGAFREDLYYRLNVFPIRLPDLRDRRSDILLLAEHFLARFSERYGKSIRRISTPAINMLVSYHWPGNVRELENCIERAVLAARSDVLSAPDLPPTLQTAAATGTERLPDAPSVPDGDAPFSVLVSSYERELIVEALKKTDGNVSAAARALGLSRRVILYKIKRLSVTPAWYRTRRSSGS
jgi:Nif-specific regulatory protein